MPVSERAWKEKPQKPSALTSPVLVSMRAEPRKLRKLTFPESVRTVTGTLSGTVRR